MSEQTQAPETPEAQPEQQPDKVESVIADRDKLKQRAHRAEVQLAELLEQHKELQSKIMSFEDDKARAENNVQKMIEIRDAEIKKLSEDRDRLNSELQTTSNRLKWSSLLDGILQHTRPENRELVEGLVLRLTDKGDLERYPEDVEAMVKKGVKIIKDRHPKLMGTGNDGSGVPGMPGVTLHGKDFSELPPDQQSKAGKLFGGATTKNLF